MDYSSLSKESILKFTQKMNEALIVDDVKVDSPYQTFKKTDDFSSYMKALTKLRPDVNPYIIEVYVYQWFVTEVLKETLPEVEMPPKEPVFQVLENVEVYKNEAEWKEKYGYLEEIPIKNNEGEVVPFYKFDEPVENKIL